MAIKYIDELEKYTLKFPQGLKGKRVLARFDFNVPLKDGKIKDTTRIDEAIPTIKLLLSYGISKLTLMSHLGRPDGEKDPAFSLSPIADYLARVLGVDVYLAEGSVDAGVKDLLKLPSTKIVLLENLRFHKEETQNESTFCQKLAEYGDVFVMDAFGAAHRKHASTYGIIQYFPDSSFAGLLMKKEILALEKILEPEKPFMAIIGGAKVSDKIQTLDRLLTGSQHILIGGAMAYPFLKAKGNSIGNSLCTDQDVELAKGLLRRDDVGKIILPIDHIVSDSLEGKPTVINDPNIPDGQIGLDIGPKTLELFEAKLKKAKTIFWNGPMGLFENPDFAKGTLGVAKILSELSSFRIVGGGDSVSAVKKSGLSDKFSHVSTGGGASLEFIEKGTLPGIEALRYGLR